MADFFGGGDTKIKNVGTLTAGQSGLLDLIVNQLSGQFQGGELQGLTPFQGTRPAEVPFSPLQQQGFGLAGGLAPGIGAGFDIFGQSLQGFDPQQGQGLLQGGLDLLGQSTQQFDPQSVLDALEPGRQLALSTFNRDIIPGLSEQFGATSGASGSFDRAVAEAGADLSLGLNAQAAPFLFQGQQNQLGRQLQGAGLSGQFAGIPGQLAGQGLGIGGGATDLLSQLLNIGGQQRGLPQGIAGSNQQRFNESQPFANQLFNQLAGLGLGTSAFQPVAMQGSQGFGSALLPALGAFAGTESGAGQLGGLFSGIGGLFNPV